MTVTQENIGFDVLKSPTREKLTKRTMKSIPLNEKSLTTYAIEWMKRQDNYRGKWFHD